MQLGRKLAEGYAVDCVSPSPSLTRRARALLGDEQQIFECRYEDLKTDRRYDLILFSESFQYLEMAEALSISEALLSGEGYLLISDFFRKDTPERGPFGGGHPLAEFRRQIAARALRPVVDEDITPRIAPNLDLTADFTRQVVEPVKEELLGNLAARHPLLSRALRWVFRRHLREAEEKYFSGKRSGANFQVYKSYRLLLFQYCGKAAA